MVFAWPSRVSGYRIAAAIASLVEACMSVAPSATEVACPRSCVKETTSAAQTPGRPSFSDPRKLYETEAYYQLGEPRVYGIDVRYEFH